ncbi:YaiO family outer membrane beta-barrel protein [Phenylobacterium sp.]|uniref:YaiO family outer membrane beta-barrel protein n=1 Tax=Phenylobacterium sp. TaxID=1871053 RepID=UPI002F92BA53
MKTVLAAALFAAVPAVLCAQPADDGARGRELRLAGRPAEAIPLLEAAAQASPADADVWLDLGLAYAAVQRYADAERALAQARRLAPEYMDVQLAQARLAYWRGDVAEAERRLQPILAAGEHDEARELAAQLAAARQAQPYAWRVDLSGARSNLSAGLSDWSRAAVAVTRRLSDTRSVGAYVEHAQQFGFEDTYGEATFGFRRGYVSLGGSADADFRPEWQVRGGVYGTPHAIGAGWTATLSLDASWARYWSGDVRYVQPAVTLVHGQSWIYARWINSFDEREDYRSGYSVYGSWAATPKLRLSAGWAAAPESNQGVTVDVRALSGGVAVDLDSATTVRLDTVHEMRDAYDRTELSVGLTRRF